MLYPEIEPYDTGMLDAGDGHAIYWEVCGNPTGKPVIVLHGGPGSGCTPTMRRFFDPDAYRIVLFDQRGCGRSTPHAGAPHVDLKANTTRHLLADIERLRKFLAIEKFLVFGSSWGSTLALAYAEKKPWLVNGIVLVGVTMTRRTEIDWLYSGVRRLRPEAWAAFQAGVPESERDRDLVEAYHRLLINPDPAIHQPAARRWCAWEHSLVSSDPNAKPDPARQEPMFQLAFSRIVTHYFRHNAWLEDGVLLKDAAKLAGIPGIMIHGRLDLAAPLMTAWELDRAWPDGRLVVVDGAGHSSGDQGMADAMIAATDEFTARR
ncbi:MAG: prolyl aminopeptidase [Pseudomonadota bacterium]